MTTPASAEFPHLPDDIKSGIDAYASALASGEATHCPQCGAFVRIKDGGHWVLAGIWHALTNVPQMTPIQ